MVSEGYEEMITVTNLPIVHTKHVDTYKAT